MKRVLITGASGGIGSAIAKEFAAEGYELVLHCHNNLNKLNDLKAELQDSLTYEPVLVTGDLSKEDDVNAIVAKAGDIDVLVNNAGITRDRLLVTMKPEDFDTVIEANLRSVYLTTHAVRHDKAQMGPDHKSGKCQWNLRERRTGKLRGFEGRYHRFFKVFSEGSRREKCHGKLHSAGHDRD